MKAATIAALSLLIVLPVQAGQRLHQSVSPVTSCDNDGHCSTFGMSTASIRTGRKKTRSVTAKAATPATTEASKVEAAPEVSKVGPESPAANNKEIAAKSDKTATKAATPSARVVAALDANGNKALGIVVSAKTGARARVGAAYAARFQAYIDDLENSHGARILFMGGLRPGRCSPASQHPCGKALDVCQLRRGVVDSRCNLPGRVILGQIAAAHGLFEGGRWCHSDYGHAQISVTAAACGDSHIRIVRRMAPEQVSDGPRP